MEYFNVNRSFKEELDYYLVKIEPNLLRFPEFKTEIKFNVGTQLQLEKDLISKSNFKVIHRLSPTILKFMETCYFRDLLVNNLNNELLTSFHLSAFLSAARSVTFVLQKESTHKEGFKEWYQSKQDVLKEDEIMTLLVQLRNESEKEGLETLTITPMRLVKIHLNNTISYESYSEIKNLENIKFQNLNKESEYILEQMRMIIYDADLHNFLDAKTENSELEAGIKIIKEIKLNEWWVCDQSENLIRKYD